MSEHTPTTLRESLELAHQAAASDCEQYTLDREYNEGRRSAFAKALVLLDRHEKNKQNAHDALLAACKAVVEECDATFVDTSEMSSEWCEVEKMCRAAIALAEQEPTP